MYYDNDDSSITYKSAGAATGKAGVIFADHADETVLSGIRDLYGSLYVGHRDIERWKKTQEEVRRRLETLVKEERAGSD